MKYPLAKKLKDAGFPQEGTGDKVFAGFSEFDLNLDNKAVPKHVADYVYKPTLSELIEACGNYLVIAVAKDGSAIAASNHVSPSLMIHGTTPEEAVANLFLALNPITV